MEPLTADDLAELGAVNGSIKTITTLKSGQRSRNMLLLRELLNAVDKNATEDSFVARFRESFGTLCAVETAAPRLVASLLAGPHFGSWVAECLRLLMGVRPEEERPFWIDLAHLGALAVSFAMTADIEVEAMVPVRSGRAVIPGIGCVLLDEAPAWEIIAIHHHGDGALTVIQPNRLVSVPRERPIDSKRWQKIRHLQGSCEGLQVELELDDLDPYRDSSGLGAADRLTDNEVERWQDQFARAWSVLAKRHREDAAAIAATMRTLVPLAPRRAGSGVSATLRYASGAVSMTPQTDDIRLARTLVHELHHMKLNLLMDSMPLHRAGPNELFYSPWRDDPRPLTGLMHGVYAGIAVANFWRTERDGSDDDTLAEFELARARRQVEIGLPSLARSNQLSSTGMALMRR
jgi:HEXXH motif-containing protein